MIIDKIALVLVILGGVNAGIAGIFGIDTMAHVLGGADTRLARIAAIVIGVAALWSISLLFRNRRDGEAVTTHVAHN